MGAAPYDQEVVDHYRRHRDAPTSPNQVMEEPAILDHLGPVDGCRVVDLGCGDGAFAEVLLLRGAASYLGTDESPAMIAAAQCEHGDPRARFEVARIEDLRLAPGEADLVTSRLALHHVDDLDDVLQRIRVGLVEGGRLLVTVAHPVITAPEESPVGQRESATIDRYFEPGPRRRSWFGSEVTWYHRTIEQYLRSLQAAGFALEALSECEPSPARLADAPDELARRRRVPLVLLLAARAVA